MRRKINVEVGLCLLIMKQINVNELNEKKKKINGNF